MLIGQNGISFKNNEKTNLLPIQTISHPDFVYLNLPLEYTVNIAMGEKIHIGKAVASSNNNASPPIYSTVSGTVYEITENQIVIKNDFENTVHQGLSPIGIPLKELSEKDIESISRLMGIYDDGVLLADKLHDSKGNIERIVISCTDSQPPCGISFPLCKEYPKELLGGIKIIIHATKARLGIITLSGTNEEFSKKLKEEISDNKLITVRVVENRYPMENSKYLLHVLTRREHTDSTLVKESRCLILKAESVISLYQAFTTGIPKVNKFLSVAGYVGEKKNISVPIGTKISHVLDFCGCKRNDNCIIINGGIMAGNTIDEESVITNEVNTITVLEKQTEKERSCIRCGRCVETCPMLLKPLYLYSNIISNKKQKNIYLGINQCIECGCCSYVCPAKLPLSQSIKKGKKG